MQRELYREPLITTKLTYPYQVTKPTNQRPVIKSKCKHIPHHPVIISRRLVGRAVVSQDRDREVLSQLIWLRSSRHLMVRAALVGTDWNRRADLAEVTLRLRMLLTEHSHQKRYLSTGQHNNIVCLAAGILFRCSQKQLKQDNFFNGFSLLGEFCCKAQIGRAHV